MQTTLIVLNVPNHFRNVSSCFLLILMTMLSLAVGDEEVIRFLHFINGFNQIFNNSEDQIINDKYIEIRKYLKEKKDGDMDSRDILTIKGLIRRGEARTACTYNNIPLDSDHFLEFLI